MRICKSIDDTLYTSSVRDIYTLVYTTHDKMPSKKYAMCLDHICGIPCRWILVFVFPCLWLPVLLWMWTKQEEGTWGQNFAPWLVLNCAFSHMPMVAFLIPHHQSQSLFMSCAALSEGNDKDTTFFNLGVDPCLVCCAVVVLIRPIWTFAQKCRWIVLKRHLDLVSGAENGGDHLRMKMQVAPRQI